MSSYLLTPEKGGHRLQIEVAEADVVNDWGGQTLGIRGDALKKGLKPAGLNLMGENYKK